jgi:hypothetical protein
MEPTAALIEFPKGYGRPKKPLEWATVRAELERAKQYWLATTRSNGRPHVVPLDGIWVDDVWYYGGAEDTVHRRTVEANPNAVLHLPDPLKVVIVEGDVRRSRPSPEEARRLAEASSTKYVEYGYPNDPSAYAEAFGLYPRTVIAWMSFPADATRFTFTRGRGRR